MARLGGGDVVLESGRGSAGGGEEAGILELAACQIFDHICRTEDRVFLLKCSFVQIYNEQVNDLLAVDTSVSLPVCEGPRGVYIESTEVPIVDYDTISNTLCKGNSGLQI